MLWFFIQRRNRVVLRRYLENIQFLHFLAQRRLAIKCGGIMDFLVYPVWSFESPLMFMEQFCTRIIHIIIYAYYCMSG